MLSDREILFGGLRRRAFARSHSVKVLRPEYRRTLCGSERKSFMDVNQIILGLKKRINVSAETEKTAERAAALWKTFNNAAKREVLELAAVSATTARKAYQEGALTAGLALALAKVGSINPAYLAAQSDAKGKFTQRTVSAFLKSCGYPGLDDASAEEAAGAPAEAGSKENGISSDAESCDCGCDCGGCDYVEEAFDFTEEDLVLLLRALNLRARWNEEAREKLDKIVDLLL